MNIRNAFCMGYMNVHAEMGWINAFKHRDQPYMVVVLLGMVNGPLA